MYHPHEWGLSNAGVMVTREPPLMSGTGQGRSQLCVMTYHLAPSLQVASCQVT